MTRRPPATTLLLLLVLLAGCGKQHTATTPIAPINTTTTDTGRVAPAPSDKAQIDALTRRFTTAYNTGNTTAACAMMTGQAQRQMITQIRQVNAGISSCPAAVAVARQYQPRIPTPRLTHFVISSARATATNNAVPESQDDHVLRYARQNGRWRIAP